VNGETNYVYRYFIDIIKEGIPKTGYIPICYVGDQNLDIEENLKEILNYTVGAVFLFGQKTDREKINNLGIPIISVMNASGSDYSFVTVNYRSFFDKINLLIQKYNLEDNLIFSIHPKMAKSERGTFILMAFEYYYSRYNLISVPYAYTHPVNSQTIRGALKKLKKIPDSIIFLDDTLYMSCLPMFPEFDYIFSKTKIITHSSGKQEYIEKYKICSVEFDIKKLAEEALNLLIKRINGEFINKQNIYIDAKIINEDIFKK
ncbi:MAG: hypothetical protein KBT47_02600, partial [Armatimonadetes bacterium]|nr:hypothetical protein [Candidatus Hippobium faecium]